jgi:hypothetical protein
MRPLVPINVLSVLAMALFAFPKLSVSAGTLLPLSPVYRIEHAGGDDRFATECDLVKPRSGSNLAFYAVCTNVWPPGLVPIFAVENGRRLELRRRPARGQENFSEPLFFALPNPNEPEASKIAGRWDCRATRDERAKSYLSWELAIEGEMISGRFDQDTDYRFAFITGGTFRSNRLELRVEHMQNRYLLTGKWEKEKLRGDWQRDDQSERGTWEAERPREGKLAADKHQMTWGLYEWRRVSDNARRYALDGQFKDPGWERSSQPLCHVWRQP